MPLSAACAPSSRAVRGRSAAPDPAARCPTTQPVRPRAAPCVCRAARRRSALHCSATSASTAPSGTQDGLLLGLGPPGAFDSHALGGPAVKCFIGDNETRWQLFYHGRAAPAPGPYGAEDGAMGCVGLAVSEDGVSWRRGGAPVETMSSGAAAEDGSDCGVVLSVSDDWWTFNTAAVGQPDVQVLSSGAVASGVGVYWMFYAGADFSKTQPLLAPGAPLSTPADEAPGRCVRVGLALSQNGLNWARIEGPHHTGALFDCGAAGEWDAGGCFNPRVLVAGPRDLRLFYCSPDARTGCWAIGTARSADGLTWTKAGRVFEKDAAPGAWDARGVSAAHVHRTGRDTWLMFYEGHAENGQRAIGLATSRDGIRWSRHAPGAPPLLCSTDRHHSAWDAGGVGAPFAVPMAEGRWRLYYEGYDAAVGADWKARGSQAARGIGLALSEEAAAGTEVAGRPFRRRTVK